MDLNRNVYEGWTPQDFIDSLEDSFQCIMRGRSWQAPFETKEKVIEWVTSNQPYYKKKVPEVIKHFWDEAKYFIKNKDTCAFL